MYIKQALNKAHVFLVMFLKTFTKLYTLIIILKPSLKSCYYFYLWLPVLKENLKN